MYAIRSYYALDRLRAAQEVELLRDDLAAVAVDTGCVGPFRVVDATLDENLHALLAMLRDRFAEAIEAGDAVRPPGMARSNQIVSEPRRLSASLSDGQFPVS